MSQHWNALYGQTKDLYGTAANQFIQEIAQKIPITGHTLAIAEGEGRNILYLAQQARQHKTDFSGEVWDYADVALQSLAQKVQAMNLELVLRHIDLTEAVWPINAYQNVICVFGHFDQCTQQQVLHGIRQSLQPGGWFIGEVYSTEQLKYATGGPGDPDYLYDPRTILNTFQHDHIQHFYLGEQERYEGALHSGLCHVIQFAIQIIK